MIDLHDEAATHALGLALGRALQPGDAIVLEGDLGAGKTRLTQAIALALGVDDLVTSPTFALVHEYEGRVPLVHVDLYRIGDIGEAIELGLRETRSAVLVVEWGERYLEALPEVAVILRIGLGEGEARTVRIEPRTPRGRELVDAVR